MCNSKDLVNDALWDNKAYISLMIVSVITTHVEQLNKVCFFGSIA